MRRTTWLLPAALLAVVMSLANSGHAARKPKPAPAHPGPPQAEEPADALEAALTMSQAVACSTIDGYEQFESLPGAALTSDEKLLVYYRPLHYRTEHSGSTYRIHLTQDGQIRHRGEKAVLLFKANMVDYDWKSKERDNPVYIRNTFSLKGLKPGEYDYDIILHDVLAPDEPTAKQTVEFRVVPPGPRDEGKK
jgi:hypothetical protein